MPVERQIGGAREALPVESDRLSSLEDSCNNVRREIAQTQQDAQMPPASAATASAKRAPRPEDAPVIKTVPLLICFPPCPRPCYTALHNRATMEKTGERTCGAT